MDQMIHQTPSLDPSSKMPDATESQVMQEVKVSLAAVAQELNTLARESVGTRTELVALKDRVLDRQDRHEDDLATLRAEVSVLRAEVLALKSRQTPLTAPTAWIALIISGLVAAKSVLGF